MPQTIEAVESERKGQNEFSSVFNCVREPLHKLDNVSRIEGGGSKKVGKREAIED